MAISVSYGPITAALQLAQQAGEGQNWWRRRQAEAEIQDRLQRRQLQAQQLGESARAREISLALQQQNQQQSQAFRERTFQAQQEERDYQRSLNEQQLAEKKAQRAEFAKKFGVTPEQFQAEMARQQQERLQQAQNDRNFGAQTSALGRMVSLASARVKDAQRRVTALETDDKAMFTFESHDAYKQAIRSAKDDLQAAQDEYNKLLPILKSRVSQVNANPNATQGFNETFQNVGPVQTPMEQMPASTPQEAGGQMAAGNKMVMMQQLPPIVQQQINSGMPPQDIDFGNTGQYTQQQLLMFQQIMKQLYPGQY